MPLHKHPLAGSILLTAAALLAAAPRAAAAPSPSPSLAGWEGHRCTHFDSPVTNLFVQESAAAALPAGGQHEAFGARLPWPTVHARLRACGHACKLLLLVRHGQAVSNAVEDQVGHAEWDADIGKRCEYEGGRLYDAPLTDNGVAESQALGQLLSGGWAGRVAGGSVPKVVSSPLTRRADGWGGGRVGVGRFDGAARLDGGSGRSLLVARGRGPRLSPAVAPPRAPTHAPTLKKHPFSCLNTSILALSSVLHPKDMRVAEHLRERYGVNTCDARRSASGVAWPAAPCETGSGLRDDFEEGAFGGFRIVGGDIKGLLGGRKAADETTGAGGELGADDASTGAATTSVASHRHHRLGLISDGDDLWTARAREAKKHVVQRACAFLDVLYKSQTTADARVVYAVSHSGTIRGLLAGLGREPYPAANSEVVPVFVRRHNGGAGGGPRDGLGGEARGAHAAVAR